MLGRLEESFSRMQRFTADAAHELGTPLTGLRTTAELALRRPREAEEYREALQQVVSIAERMTNLSEGMLALALASTHTRPRPRAGWTWPGWDMKLSERPVLPGADADADAMRRLVTVLLDNARLIHTGWWQDHHLAP
jgi:signal transduction histidine kinase